MTKGIDADQQQDVSHAQSWLRHAMPIFEQKIRTEWPWASARAVGVGTGGGTKVCVLALATSGVNFKGSGSGDLNADHCSAYFNSDTNLCFTVVSTAGTAKIVAPDIYLRKNIGCTDGPHGISGTQRFPNPQQPDPYAIPSRIIPTASSCTTITIKSGVNELSPGIYCGIKLNFGQKVKLTSPDVYIIAGGAVELNGDIEISGTDVSIVLTKLNTCTIYSKLQINGTSKITITAYNSNSTAPTRGIGIWIDKKGTGGAYLSGSSKISLTSAVYAPSGEIEVNGTSQILAAPCGQLIASFIESSVNAIPDAFNISHECDGYKIETVSVGGGSGALSLKE